GHAGAHGGRVVDAAARIELQPDGVELDGPDRAVVVRPVAAGRDRGAGSLPRGSGERGVVVGGPTTVDDHQERHDEEGRDQGHFDHRLTTLALHCWACTCIVVEATT